MVLGLTMLIAIVFPSCNKKETDDLSVQLQVPEIEIVLNGKEVITLQTGQTYQDEGAQVIHQFNGTSSVMAFNPDEVDYSTSGIYVLKYLHKDQNGFSALNTRAIAVYGTVTNPVQFGSTYKRIPQNTIMKIDKVSSNLHIVTNFGGVPATNALSKHSACLLQKGPDDFEIKTVGAAAADNIDIELIKVQSDTIQLVIFGGAYAPTLRTFVK